MRFRAVMISLTLFCLGNLAESAPAPPRDYPKASEQGQEARGAAPRPVIELRGDLLSVRVHSAPWEAVLKEIERQTGVMIRVEGPMAGTLTQEFEALPLEKGLRRLFRDANLLFFYAKGTKGGPAGGTLTRVWVFPKEGIATEERQVRPPPSGPATGGKQDDLGSLVKNALESEEAEEREKALTALGDFKDPRIMGALIEALRDADAEVRDSAVDTLGQMKDERAIEPLSRALLEDPSEDVRESAADALGLVRHPRGVEALSKALGDPSASVRESAAESLGIIGGKDAIEVLRRAARDEDEDVREAAAAALRQLTGADRSGEESGK